MTSSQSKLKRPDTQPAPERGFAGRAPLITGILAKKDQIMASATILKLASRAVVAANAEKQYARMLYDLGKAVSESRRAERIDGMIREAMEEMEGIPQTKREALEMALRKRGVEARIVDEREMASFTFFKITFNGQERAIPFPNNIMEGDAVANFEQVLKTAGIAGSSRELMESRKEESGSIRPPPEPIEVDLKRLERRKISYDGQINGKVSQFTYYADEIGTSFGLPVDLKNGELVAEIDKRILEIHASYNVPLDPSVVEAQAMETRKFRVPADGEVEAVANAIHYLLENNIGANILPLEFREAVERLRASEEYLAVKTALPLSGGEGAEFAEAYRQLDNPAHAMVRMIHPHFCNGEGELTEEGKKIVRETLELGKTEDIAIDGAALANLALACSILSGENISHFGEEQLRKMHLGMMFTIRGKMKDLTGGLIFKPVSAQ